MNKSSYFYLIALIFSLNLNCADSKEGAEINKIIITAGNIFEHKTAVYLQQTDEVFREHISLEVTIEELIYHNPYTKVTNIPFSSLYDTKKNRFFKNNEIIIVDGVNFKLVTNLDLNKVFETGKKEFLFEYQKYNHELRQSNEQASRIVDAIKQESCCCTIL